MTDKLIYNEIESLEKELFTLLEGVNAQRILSLACQIVKLSAKYNDGYTAEELHKVLISKGIDIKEELEMAESIGEDLRDN